MQVTAAAAATAAANERQGVMSYVHVGPFLALAQQLLLLLFVMMLQQGERVEVIWLVWVAGDRRECGRRARCSVAGVSATTAAVHEKHVQMTRVHCVRRLFSSLVSKIFCFIEFVFSFYFLTLLNEKLKNRV